jgi:cytochrome P450
MNREKDNLPPGPSGRIRTSWRVMNDPIGSALEWRDRYGDPYTLDAINGVCVMTGRADLIKKIFRLSDDDFHPFAREAAEPLVGDKAILVTDGDAHRRDRKLLMPPFHGERMRAYGETIRALTRRALADIEVGETFSMHELGRKLALQVIVRVVFGVEEDDRLDAACDVISRTMDAASPSFIFAPALQREFLGFGPYARFMRQMRELRVFVDDQLERTRARGGGDDILSLMLEARYDDGSAMDDDAIFDQLRTLLVAGHETTAIALAWAMGFVLGDPQIESRLQDELEACDAAPESWIFQPYLKAVCEESLRLYPVVTEVLRTLQVPFEMDGWTVPAGRSVGASIITAHRDPDVYEDPLAFSPERFVGKTFGPDVYLPFGGGTRRCIGAAFALYEMRVILATLLTEASFERASTEPLRAVRRSITVAPACGVPLVRRDRERTRVAA